MDASHTGHFVRAGLSGRLAKLWGSVSMPVETARPVLARNHYNAHVSLLPGGQSQGYWFTRRLHWQVGQCAMQQKHLLS
jgi:hypothetical protein